MPVKGRAVVAVVNGEPVAEVDKLTATRKKKKQTVYLSSDPMSSNPEKTIRVHREKSEAIGRFSNRAPKITPRFRKLI